VIQHKTAFPAVFAPQKQTARESPLAAWALIINVGEGIPDFLLGQGGKNLGPAPKHAKAFVDDFHAPILAGERLAGTKALDKQLGRLRAEPQLVRPAGTWKKGKLWGFFYQGPADHRPGFSRARGTRSGAADRSHQRRLRDFPPKQWWAFPSAGSRLTAHWREFIPPKNPNERVYNRGNSDGDCAKWPGLLPKGGQWARKFPRLRNRAGKNSDYIGILGQSRGT